MFININNGNVCYLTLLQKQVDWEAAAQILRGKVKMLNVLISCCQLES